MQKTLFLFVLLLCTAGVTFSQTISPKDAVKYVGQTVTVCGKIFGGKYLDAVKNKPTFLNMGATYPNQLLTIVIWGDSRKNFSYAAEEKLKNKTVCVTGKVEMFKGKPQITINGENQIKEE
ncbi:MAG TPA: hypothetical protein PLA68_03760 [Panacibacter sp.]|nr:hypothetical protein [Panacibacter sp.]